MASGSIKKRVGKRGTTWQAVIEMGIGPDGKRKQHTRTFKRKREAQDYLTKTLHELNTGIYIQPSTMLLSEFAEHWFDTIDVRASSEVRYRSAYHHHIEPVFGHIALGEITTSDIQEWFNEKRRAHRSSGQMLIVLNAMLKLAVKQRKLVMNPCEGVERGRERDEPSTMQEEKAWSPAQLISFLDQTRGHRDWAAWWVMAYTGIRPGELVALHWSDIDLAERTLRVRVTQTMGASGKRVLGTRAKNRSSERTIGLDPETVLVLTGHRAEQVQRSVIIDAGWQETGIVFDRGDGQMQDVSAISQRFARLVEKLDLPSISLHGMRHTHASILAMTVSLNDVQNRLGHKTLATTSKFYLHMMPGTQHHAAQAFASTLNQNRKSPPRDRDVAESPESELESASNQ